MDKVTSVAKTAVSLIAEGSTFFGFVFRIHAIVTL
jgi:hypothetical protein